MSESDKVTGITFDVRSLTDHAIAAARSIDDEGLMAAALATIVKALTQAGHFSEALVVAQSIEDAMDGEEALTVVGQALAKSGQSDQSLLVVQSLEESWRKASALANIAQTLAQEGYASQAQQGLDQAHVLAQSIEDEWEKGVALEAIAISLANMGRIDEGYALAQTLSEGLEREYALMVVAQTFAQANQIERAFAVAQMVDDPGFKARALTAIARTLAKNGQDAQSLQVFDDAITMAKFTDEDGENWVDLGTPRIVYQTLAEVGYTERAFALAESQREAEDKVEALMTIAQTLIDLGRNELAQPFFTQALAVTKLIDDSWSKEAALTTIAVTLAKAGQIDWALTIVETLEEEDLKATALTQIAQTLIQRGQTERARQLLNEALKFAQAIDHSWEHGKVLTAIFSAGILATA